MRLLAQFLQDYQESMRHPDVKRPLPDKMFHREIRFLVSTKLPSMIHERHIRACPITLVSLIKDSKLAWLVEAQNVARDWGLDDNLIGRIISYADRSECDPPASTAKEQIYQCALQSRWLDLAHLCEHDAASLRFVLDNELPLGDGVSNEPR